MMARGRFLARHFWRGRTYETSDVVEASSAQIEAWVAAGIVERLPDPVPPRQPAIERAEAPAPPENAAIDPAPRKRGRPRKQRD